MISTSTTATEDKSDLAVCKLCRRQFAKYTCPSCNVPYCSLTCSRSESHGECSESFYRKEVETDIQSEPSKTAEERRSMMKLLKKFEEDSLKQDEGDGDGEEEGSDDETNTLAKRLRDVLCDVDLDSTSPDDLWTLLTPLQQQKFMKALQDPSSDLTQQLLAGEQIQKESLLPWWNDDGELELEGKRDDEYEYNSGDFPRHRKGPIPMPIPTNMVKSFKGGPLLIYNTVAVLITYAYTTRYFASSPLSSIPPHSSDILEVQGTISQITPFLIERKANMVFGNVREVVMDVWARLGQENVNSEALAVFLRDAAKLLWPLPVMPLPPPPPTSSPSLSELAPTESMYDYASHPHRCSVLALADLYHLYSIISPSPPTPPSILPRTKSKSKHNPTTQKLIFYSARLLALPSHILSMVSEELITYIELMKGESVQEGLGAIASPSSNTLKREVESIKPLVVEI